MPFLNSHPSSWNFNIDAHMNPFLRPPPWSVIPYPIAHFLGYRRPSTPGSGSRLGDDSQLGNIPKIFWAAIGSFTSLSIIALVSHHIPLFRENGAPVIIGSFGAAAVLEFYSITSPLAQPRNAILSQLIASLTGVCINKLFSLSSDPYRLVGGALACALSIMFMALTNTVHPPAGATALLAVTDEHAVELGWLLVPLMMLGCAIMLSVALLVDNVQRRFPLYWWTDVELPASRGGGGESGRSIRAGDEEQGVCGEVERKDEDSSGDDAPFGQHIETI
ncbi:hpp family protein [Zalerion maritima]|uniref:Hpp family protein n=1 Tax=Zalerion maritima TaxID=339359 RepID=A0AAD5RQE7_9PEZI|nr:hpp family protein [Zalerion maritima]